MLRILRCFPVLLFLLCLLISEIPRCEAARAENQENLRIIRYQVEDFFIPQISGLTDHKLQDKINGELLVLISRFNRPEHYNSLRGDFTITYYNRHVLGIHFMGTSFLRRAAHPSKLDFGIHIDLETGTIYELRDLFKPATDYKGRIKELCRTNEAGYRSTDPRWSWDGWTYEQFAHSWNGERFLLSADSLRVYDSLNFATGYYSGYHIPFADLADIINTDGPMWKALKNRESTPIDVETEQIDLDDFFLREYDLKPGDSASWVMYILGEPKFKTQVQDGVRYDYDNLEVVISPQNQVVNILTENKQVSTRRWVHPGDLIGKVKKRYGEAPKVSSWGEYDLFEYVLCNSPPTLQTTYILRFAVKKGTNTVSYIGWRISNNIAPLNTSIKHGEPAPAIPAPKIERK